MKVEINFDADNASFEDPEQGAAVLEQAGRHLADVQRSVQRRGEYGITRKITLKHSTRALMDFNGNKVGEVKVIL